MNIKPAAPLLGGGRVRRKVPMKQKPFLFALALAVGALPGAVLAKNYALNDSHFHLTNYIQEGTDIRDFLKIDRRPPLLLLLHGRCYRHGV